MILIMVLTVVLLVIGQQITLGISSTIYKSIMKLKGVHALEMNFNHYYLENLLILKIVIFI
jgi:hypothetical protein